MTLERVGVRELGLGPSLEWQHWVTQNSLEVHGAGIALTHKPLGHHAYPPPATFPEPGSSSREPLSFPWGLSSPSTPREGCPPTSTPTHSRHQHWGSAATLWAPREVRPGAPSWRAPDWNFLIHACYLPLSPAAGRTLYLPKCSSAQNPPWEAAPNSLLLGFGNFCESVVKQSCYLKVKNKGKDQN